MISEDLSHVCEWLDIMNKNSDDGLTAQQTERLAEEMKNLFLQATLLERGLLPNSLLDQIEDEATDTSKLLGRYAEQSEGKAVCLHSH